MTRTSGSLFATCVFTLRKALPGLATTSPTTEGDKPCRPQPRSRPLANPQHANQHAKDNRKLDHRKLRRRALVVVAHSINALLEIAATRREIERAQRRPRSCSPTRTPRRSRSARNAGRSAQSAYKEVTKALKNLQRDAKKANAGVLKDLDKLKAAVTNKKPARSRLAARSQVGRRKVDRCQDDGRQDDGAQRPPPRKDFDFSRRESTSSGPSSTSRSSS